MIERLAWTVTNYMVEREVVIKEDDEIYAFGFECLIADIIQYAILLLAGFMLRNILHLALISAGFVALRKHIGGYHANSHHACIFIASLILICGSLVCALFPIWSNAIILPVAYTIIYLLAPIEHKNNPKTEEEHRLNRKLSLRNATSVTIAAIILIASPFKDLAIYLSGGLLLASFTLIVPNKAI